MIDLKIDSVQWSPDETSLIVKFAEPAPTNPTAATAAQTLVCYVRVPVSEGEALFAAMLRAEARLADTTVVLPQRPLRLN